MQQITNEQMKAELASQEMTLETMMRTIATIMNSETCNRLHDDLIAQAVAKQDEEIDAEQLEKSVNTAILAMATRTMAEMVIEIWGEDTAEAIAHEMDEIGIDGCLEMLGHFINDCDNVA